MGQEPEEETVVAKVFLQGVVRGGESAVTREKVHGLMITEPPPETTVTLS